MRSRSGAVFYHLSMVVKDIGDRARTTFYEMGGQPRGGLPLPIAIAPNDTCRGDARVPAQLSVIAVSSPLPN